ncbi:MAG: sn-glycerol-1-phosphate dehydrogenase [Alicyclobacillus sp.]|nr:sn-glycerol-1-phosphate dehydrogenase [Alicyclobacillus sp.]
MSEDAMDRLETYIESHGYMRVLTVADANTVDVAGAELNRRLQRVVECVNAYVFPQREGLLADHVAVDAVEGALQGHRTDLVVAVGSGVINDIVRYVTHRAGVPYVLFATAPSMDGYVSTVAAMQFRGVKTTLPAQAPQAVFADPCVLAQAPWEMVVSGFGDLMGKAIALLDWRLSHHLYREYVCERAMALVESPLAECVRRTKALKRRDREAVEQLFQGLVSAGLAMAMVGNSRPASGSEHHCSHYWDFLSYKGRRGHYAHGLQVGYATHWMADVYRMVPHIGVLGIPEVPEVSQAWMDEVRSRYGTGADTVVNEQAAKQAWLLAQESDWPGRDTAAVWAAIAPTGYSLDEVERALEEMGIRHRIGELEVDAGVLRETLLHAYELRARYTVLDLLRGQGKLAEVADRVTSA